ncbi:LLM class flavin-dependent oxidoreductase [Mycobacterium riyadhense]|uniref:5,10-methylene tetrahydromethanopterin reductase n=1 Tax=Mycobacterium riyadhense TaxID=486698 RepID=A0A1X2BUP6_9MYCO|nr:LLM class flavin-dependent oxidoreductase [Mycobacterium riyadhense]MCV7145272.1 LLM class flavin-dependent oxidoreductase [Mycobacterium riyadhense]ORW67321.1 5,10-methylene tetrahydromethanopterin reductase [Mycobacterium riyadhense]
MQKTIGSGVFIPISNHGWIRSVHSPAVETAEYTRVLEIVRGAECLGFDFVLSPANWRGLRGPSQHWWYSLESVTTSAALLQATSRINVFSTVHVTIFPPALVAKMAVTLDQIGPGRVGLNLVTGGSYLDLAHLGMWNDALDHDGRYDLADEWLDVVKRLWTDEVVTHKGRFFETMGGTMRPKPSRMPQLVNAGASSRGLRFAFENCDAALITTGDDPNLTETTRNAKRKAQELNKPNLKIFGVITAIPGSTDEEAQARLDYFEAGMDREAQADAVAGYEQNRSCKELSKASRSLTVQSSVLPGTIVGAPETLASRLAATVIDGELDALMLIVPDYVDDLKIIATKVFPLMAEYGVTVNLNATAAA